MPEDHFNACEWLLDRHVAEGRGERVAVRSGGGAFTYAQILQKVVGASLGLLQMGVRPEERVLFALRDGVEFVASFLGALRIGAIPVPVNPLSRAGDLAAIAEQARARVAIVSAPPDALVSALGGVPHLVVTDTERAGSAPRVKRFEDVMPPSTSEVPPFPGGGDFPGPWLCTGGTTGHPKLVMHRHSDLRQTYETYARGVLGILPEDRCFSIGPMFHAYGLGNSLTFPFAAGAETVLDPTRPPTPTHVCSILRSERPTLFFCVPTFYASLLASDIPDSAFSSVRFAISAAEPLPAGIWTRFRERFGTDILDGIGSTEALHMFISNRPADIVPGSSGRVVPGWEARIVDDQGHAVEPGRPGHLLVKGESMATGYARQAAWSRRTFEGEWARTGDMYTRSEDDHYTYLGRSDDMLRVSGEWVSPAEVEAVLIEHSAVAEAAVVGVPDADALIKPVAFVSCRTGMSIDSQDLIDFCRSRLPGFKCPREVCLVPELPKTATGKIQRFLLRERAL
jgi:benzoate-CoA ligase family protein